jgi:hypothetical protein
VSAKVHFCPFCGNGTLLLGSERTLFGCLKCKRDFEVRYIETVEASDPRLDGRCPCVLREGYGPHLFPHGPHGYPQGTRSPDRT